MKKKFKKVQKNCAYSHEPAQSNLLYNEKHNQYSKPTRKIQSLKIF